MKGYIYKYGFVGLLVAGILMVYLQTLQPVFKEPKLKRSLELSTWQDVSWATWSDGAFQENTSQFVRDHFGFFNSTLMNFNQLEYSVFGVVHAKGVVIGDQGYMYEQNYIDAYYGRDFIGDSLIDARTARIKQIRQKLLDSFNVQLMVVFAPGKASFYPEYIPKHLKGEYREEATNLFALKQAMRAHEIPYLDLNTWFIREKEVSEYPLLSQTGIHWSYYGIHRAIDTIMAYSETLLKQELADLVIDSIELSRKARFTDDDIEKGLNLMNRLSKQELAYPKYSYVTKDSTFQKVILMGDSYGLGLFRHGMLAKGFCSGQFWFYNRKVYSSEFYGRNLDYFDKINELKTANLVILICTEATARRFPFHFDEELHEKLFLNHSENSDMALGVREIIKGFRHDGEVMREFIEIADENRVPINGVLFNAAIKRYKWDNRDK